MTKEDQMNCCDYECNQGRDCPVRAAHQEPTAQPIQYAGEEPEPIGVGPAEYFAVVLIVLCIFYIGFMAGRVFT